MQLLSLIASLRPLVRRRSQHHNANTMPASTMSTANCHPGTGIQTAGFVEARRAEVQLGSSCGYRTNATESADRSCSKEAADSSACVVWLVRRLLLAF
jgi:hypothetical protein